MNMYAGWCCATAKGMSRAERATAAVIRIRRPDTKRTRRITRLQLPSQFRTHDNVRGNELHRVTRETASVPETCPTVRCSSHWHVANFKRIKRFVIMSAANCQIREASHQLNANTGVTRNERVAKKNTNGEQHEQCECKCTFVAAGAR